MTPNTVVSPVKRQRIETQLSSTMKLPHEAYEHLFPFCEYAELFDLALVDRDFYGAFLNKIKKIIIRDLGLESEYDSPSLVPRLRLLEFPVPGALQPINDDDPLSILVMRIFRIACQTSALLSKEASAGFLLSAVANERRDFRSLMRQGTAPRLPEGFLSAQERWQIRETDILSTLNSIKAYKKRSIEEFLTNFLGRVLPLLEGLSPSERGAAVLAAAQVEDVDFRSLLLATGPISVEVRGALEELVYGPAQGEEEPPHNRHIDSDNEN